MSSLFEQYEAASTSRPSRPPPLSTRSRIDPTLTEDPIVSSGFVDTRKGDDTPIFKRRQIDFRPRHMVGQVVVGNGQLVLAYANKNVVLRLDMETTREEELVVGKRADDIIHKLFIDPTGRHIVVSMESNENYYVSRDSSKFKVLSKARGTMIESIAWNKTRMDEASTREILVGSSKGVIFEAQIKPEEGRLLREADILKEWRQLSMLNRDEPEPVTGLRFEQFPHSASGEKKYYVMATTYSRLYQFIGFVTTQEPPIFQWLFSYYETEPVGFTELPLNPGFQPTGELFFVYPKGKLLPNAFAWLTGPGVYYGSLEFKNQSYTESVALNCRLLPYQKRSSTEQSLKSVGKEADVPAVSVLLTDFHVLVAYNDRLQAVCILNDEPVHNEFFDTRRFGGLRGLCVDQMKGNILAYSDRAVFRYRVHNESRDVWKMYLQKGEYQRAKQYCRENEAHLDQVETAHAQHLFEEKKFEVSAGLFAKTQKSFEEVALMFIGIDQQEPLKTYLIKKLENLKTQDKTQVTMITSWLMEIYLNQLGNLKDEGAPKEREHRMLRDEFRDFLKRPRVMTCLDENKHVAYELLTSHGDVEDLVFFAQEMQDYERVVNHYLQQQNYAEALDALTRQKDIELYYKFSPVLIQHVPREIVNAWISMRNHLDPKRLIPALVQYEQTGDVAPHHNEALRYLKFCVDQLGNEDEAIHNYLLSLYAKAEDEMALLGFINSSTQGDSEPNFDTKYALRLCAEHKKRKACVHLYSSMGLFEEAVQLALEDDDVELARINANKPDEGDETLRKKLWLMIARFVIEQSGDVGRAMELLNECDLLKIEDVLQFFSDFVTIDHFKDAICTSLQEYNEHIESLKREMQEATDSGEMIRQDIQEMRNKYQVVAAQQKCSICSFPLLTREFYVFPCSHVFHADCLVVEIRPHLSQRQVNRMTDLHKQLGISFGRGFTASGSASASAAASEASDDLAAPTVSEQARADLDDLIASECPYCGDFMIRTIDLPFIPPEEYEQAVTSWL
ncbi:vacuolar protein sorting-associated protein 18 homolog [Corticium candelabrum]|uniref:vacuolar protein sorting-associated protein 18 homolog n=1 Tax=Corticium candelabrum TaxID=121492 RepID=UPI002E26A581|nr:vacuolar protein sorting-associated protein 18 homolog [Corticium candelabrum]